MKELELYIHIPFCVQKCKYCDFLSAPSTCKERTSYLEILKEEIRSYKEKAEEYRISSVFVGGGTPTTLDAKQLLELFQMIHEVFVIAENAEITVEMNPGTVNKEKLSVLKLAGVNRLSIGLQSVQDEELKMLGRIHSFREFVDTYELARKAGFSNINVDLISAIPHQTTESWKQTLEVVTALNPPPEHISAYSLIIEEGTPFFERYGNGMHEDELPDEDSERQMYQDTKTILEGKGYHRYEISNYAREGYECRHNIGYWKRREYLGFGLGAASLLDECRFSNTSDLNEYLSKSFRKEKEVLTTEAQMAEFMFLGFRMIEGVSKSEFEQAFKIPMESVYGEVIKKFVNEELIETDNEYYWLTERGLDVSNYVMSEFLL